MRCVIIDDEQYALLHNKKLLEATGKMEVLATFQDASESFSAIKALQPDVIFLDIEMPFINGFEFAEKIGEVLGNVEIVFITSYDKYALRAFEVNAIDYLLKPLLPTHVEKIVNRLERYQIKNQQKELVTEQKQKYSIQLFGNYEISKPTGPVKLKWRSLKSEELLLYLLNKHNFYATKDAILNDLWPEMYPINAGYNLNTTVYRLRKAISSENLPIEIHHDQQGYWLEMSDLEFDHIHFEEIFETLMKTKEIDFLKWETFISIYKGSFLEDKEFLWLIPYREAYLRKFTQIAKKGIQYLMNKNRHVEATRYLFQLLQQIPLDEELNEVYLEILMKQQRLTEFISHYRSFSKLLEVEFEIKPTERIQDLYRKVTKNMIEN